MRCVTPTAQDEAGALVALERVPCWDTEVQDLYAETGEPRADVALQNRAELAGFLAFMKANSVRSYLEIGTWTGQTLCAVAGALDLDIVACCDHGYAQQLGLPLHLPSGARFLQADSDSNEFLRWREALGHIDMVLVDANHHYRALKKDVALALSFPHRFLALHDITGGNRHTRGVKRVWEELDGEKLEIVRDNPDCPGATPMGIGIRWGCASATERRRGDVDRSPDLRGGTHDPLDTAAPAGAHEPDRLR
jgi:hypothetical protein